MRLAAPALPLLLGLLPQEHGIRLHYQLLPDGLRLLPELLPAAYQTAAFVSNPVLSDEALGIAARFDHFDDRMDEPNPGIMRPWYQRNAARTTDAALGWLAEPLGPPVEEGPQGELALVLPFPAIPSAKRPEAQQVPPTAGAPGEEGPEDMRSGKSVMIAAAREQWKEQEVESLEAETLFCNAAEREDATVPLAPVGGPAEGEEEGPALLLPAPIG